MTTERITTAEQPTSSPDDVATGAEQVAERIFTAALGAFDLFSIYLGDRLGWYRSLVDDGPATPAELAMRTGTDERYAREWLEQQGATGLLELEDAAQRRMRIPPAVAEALTGEHSLNYIGAISGFFAAIGQHLDQLLQVYRTGGGVSWAEMGDDARQAQAAINRPWFESRLAPALQAVPDLDRVLSRAGARIIDVGCGFGWSTIALARAYPDAIVVGYDVDEPSIAAARNNAAAADLGDRLQFRVGDGADLVAEQESADRFDAAFAFECLHDMPYPVQVLSAMRAATEPDGQVVIMDEAVGDQFSAPGDDVERFMYGYSLFICLPDGLSAPDSAGTGTVLRRPLLEAYAKQAGFAAVETLPIEDFSTFRFYRLDR